MTGFQQSQQQQQQQRQQQQQTQIGARSARQTKPQAIVVHPSAESQMKRLLKGGSRQGGAEQGAGTKKLRRFAQDMCAYYVLPAPAKQRD
jgi:hypothetical protein